MCSPRTVVTVEQQSDRPREESDRRSFIIKKRAIRVSSSQTQMPGHNELGDRIGRW